MKLAVCKEASRSTRAPAASLQCFAALVALGSGRSFVGSRASSQASGTVTKPAAAVPPAPCSFAWRNLSAQAVPRCRRPNPSLKRRCAGKLPSHPA